MNDKKVLQRVQNIIELLDRFVDALNSQNCALKKKYIQLEKEMNCNEKEANKGCGGIDLRNIKRLS